jgi:hypothetical protein
MKPMTHKTGGAAAVACSALVRRLLSVCGILRSADSDAQSIECLLRLTILRLQLRNAFFVCYIGLLKLRNSITEFRYCFWFFVHNLVVGYSLPSNVQSSGTRDQMT